MEIYADALDGGQELIETDGCEWMRQRRHAAVRAHELDRLERRETDTRHVRGRVLGDEGGERGVVRGHVTGLEQRLRYVRPAE